MVPWTHGRGAASISSIFGAPLETSSYGGDVGLVPVEHYLGCMWNLRFTLGACESQSSPMPDGANNRPRNWRQHHGNRYGRWTSRLAENEAADQAASGTQCFSVQIAAEELQDKLLRFFARSSVVGVEAPPAPVEEAAWIGSLAPDIQFELFEMCPGLLVAPLCMSAEMRFAIGGVGDLIGQAYLQRTTDLLRQLSAAANGSFAREHYKIAMRTWPISAACNSARRVRDQIASRAMQGRPPDSVDLVIIFCSGDLAWLNGLRLPSPDRLRIWIYLKCSRRPPQELCSMWQCVEAQHLDPEQMYALGESRRAPSDECGGYLYHIRQQYSDLADWTIFLHDDAPRHLHLSYLNVVLKVLRADTLSSLAPEVFVHLNNDRHLSYWTQCLASALEALGLPSTSRIATYCCSQFLVHRTRIRARSLAFYDRADRWLREKHWNGLAGCDAYPNGAAKTVSALQTRPCYVLEFLWHMIFDAPPVLPRRESDASLPLVLRFSLGLSTSLPLPDFSKFLKSHMPDS